jgi:DNA repair exonuclease SbcCD ATPase subunit
MRSCTRIITAAIIVAPGTPAFVLPQFRGRRAATHIPQFLPSPRSSRSIVERAKRNSQDESIEKLQNEIDAAIRQREELRQDLEEEIRSFSERYESVNRNLQNADSRLEEETRSFQKQLLSEKKIIDGMDETIVEKTKQLESIKASGGFFQEAFGALEGLQGALAPVAALSVVALVGESVLRERKKELQQEKDRIRKQRLAEAAARQQPPDEQLPGYAQAVSKQYTCLF